MTLEPSPNSSHSLRLFAALEFPPSIKTIVSDIINRLITGAAFTGSHPAWVKPDGVHVTLAFLGWQNPERLPVLRDALTGTVRGHRPFELKLGKLELFPNPREPKVLVLGLAGQIEELQSLHDSLSTCCRDAGFSVEAQPFRPHLTLARIKSRKGLGGLTALVRSHAAIAKGDFAVANLTLFQSHMGPGGSTYTLLNQFPLQIG